MRIFFYIFLPLWPFEVFADSYDIFKELLSVIYRNFFHQPRWHKIYLCVNIHRDLNDSEILLNRSILDHKVFVVKLDAFRIHRYGKFKGLLEVRFIVNRASKEENLFAWVVKSTVSDSLEKGLSTSKKWHAVLGVADSAVASDLFFVSGNF